MPRNVLPTRRELDAFSFEWQGVHYHATIGRFEDNSIAEIFLDGGKPGSGVNIMGKDASVVFSIARQFGVPLETIQAALSQELNGMHIGPLGIALQLANMEAAERDGAVLALVPKEPDDGSR